jgi:ABC-2 type transport system ATP-binding protein
MHEPSLLILDEPTNGLGPLKQEAFFELLEEERKKGILSFSHQHNLNDVKNVCDRVGII